MGTLEIGMSGSGWRVNVSSRVEVFSRAAVNESIRILREWENIFPRENTWVQRIYEVPSMLVRLDCVVRDDRLFIYEVEERPQGAGMTSLVNLQFASHFSTLRKAWPSITTVACPKRRPGDDHLWTTAVVGVENAPSEGMLLLRCEPDQTEFHQFEERSISSLRQEGNKSYGEALGLWRPVATVDELPWESGFALKPLQGSKAKDVVIWSPNKKDRGRSTRSQIARALEKNGRMYCQPFIPPMVGPDGAFIFRVFFGWKNGAWIPLGGVWMARDNLVVHGAQDAITGPAVFEE